LQQIIWVHFFFIVSPFLIDDSSADYGVDKYDIGAGFGHFGIATDDVGPQAFAIDFDDADK
jgi:hypothetical protein